MPRLSRRWQFSWYTGNLGGAVIAKELEVAAAELGPPTSASPHAGSRRLHARGRRRQVEIVQRRYFSSTMRITTKYPGPNSRPGFPAPVARGLAVQGRRIARGRRPDCLWHARRVRCPGALRSTSPRSSRVLSLPIFPSSSPLSFELVINLKAAKAFGLTVPPSDAAFSSDHVLE